MNDQTNGQIFVYGTLRSGFQNPAYAYISRYFTLLGAAKAKGRLYDLGEYPAAIPVEEEHFIIGELYKINHPDEMPWALAQLDDYEGINAEEGRQALYTRKETLIYFNDITVTAWTYWYARPIVNELPIESGDILEYIQQKNKI